MDSPGTQFAAQTAPELQSAPAITARQRWFELALVLLIAVAPLTIRATGELFYPVTGTQMAPALSIASGLLHQISSLLLAIYFLSRRGANLKSIGLEWRWLDILKGLGLAFGALVLSSFLRSLVRSLSVALTGHLPDIRDSRTIFDGFSPGLMVIYSFSAAIFEETIVRAYVTSELVSLTIPIWLATVVSVVLQTSYHVYYGLAGALTISGVFIVFGLYYARSRKLLPVMLGHLFVDLLAVALNQLR